MYTVIERGSWSRDVGTYTIETAQGNLNQLLSDALQGKTVVIKAENGRSVKLVPTPTKVTKPRRPGSARGKIWMADDFDEPLDDFAEYTE